MRPGKNIDDIDMIEICARTLKKSNNVYQHYFLRIPSMDLELHPGRYKGGCYHRLGHTVDYRISGLFATCDECKKKLVRASYHLENAWFYPYINCETLSLWLSGKFPVSSQVIVSTLVVATFVCSIVTFHIRMSLIIFVVLIILLYFCKMNMKCTAALSIGRCKHIN